MADQAIDIPPGFDLTSARGTSTGTWTKNAAATAPEETKFLQGPQGRGFDFGQTFKIWWELVTGFRKLHFVGPCVTVFGSARFDESHRYYEMARQVGR